jgi:hypothetical protein
VGVPDLVDEQALAVLEDVSVVQRDCIVDASAQDIDPVGALRSPRT